jgi:drug/metabolite transporter (DMT)-like permease
MQEYAIRFAELLEQVAQKVRAMTVDRVAYGIKLTGLGILALTLALTALIFLLWAIFGALEIPLTTAGAFAVLGALLVGVGAYLWFKRIEEE